MEMRAARWMAAVDVVVGVDGVLRAELSAQDLDGPVGDDLVRVHVGRGPRTRLEDVEHELVVQRSRYYLLRGGDDGFLQVLVEAAELVVDVGGL
jgi:hypothetical protein